MKKSTYQSQTRTVKVIQTHTPEGKPLQTPRVRYIHPKVASKPGWLAKNGMMKAPVDIPTPAPVTPTPAAAKPATTSKPKAHATN